MPFLPLLPTPSPPITPHSLHPTRTHSHLNNSPIPPLLRRHNTNIPTHSLPAHNILHPTRLRLLTIHALRRRGLDARASLISLLVVHVFDVEGVHVAGEVAEEGEKEIDEHVWAAAGDEEDA
jgi:hypothetical protein